MTGAGTVLTALALLRAQAVDQIVVTAAPSIDAQRLADALRVYLDEFGIQVETRPAGEADDLRKRIDDARQLGEALRAVAVVRAEHQLQRQGDRYQRGPGMNRRTRSGSAMSGKHQRRNQDKEADRLHCAEAFLNDAAHADAEQLQHRQHDDHHGPDHGLVPGQVRPHQPRVLADRDGDERH